MVELQNLDLANDNACGRARSTDAVDTTDLRVFHWRTLFYIMYDPSVCIMCQQYLLIYGPRTCRMELNRIQF